MHNGVTMLKQVIVVRTDLNMRKGKIAAQVAHASMAAILPKGELTVTNPKAIEWLNGDFTKIVVGVSSEQELLAIYQQAVDQGLLCSLIQDSGRTEFKGVLTYTCVAIGADYSNVIDKITGHLKLI